MYKAAFKTFGCKLNQAETASLVRAFRENGYRIVDPEDSFDVFVMNTCTVTERSASKCRQAIRHALRNNANATIIVAGCYSQVSAEEIAQISGVDYILGSNDKLNLFDFFSSPGKRGNPLIITSLLDNEKKAVSGPGDFQKNTRAMLKIQDGCEHYCSYCIVPFTRGPCRSVPIDEVVNQTMELIQRGFKEIVLTGVHVGDYGKEKNGETQLDKLLEKLISLDGLGRIRLSSLNCEDVPERLLDLIASTTSICRHFHVSLQSGSDAILKKMNRQYTKMAYRNTVDRITSKLGAVGLGTDVIVGFPGETDEDFQETYRFVKSLPFSYLHVFPFSARQMTEAYEFKDQIDSSVKSERAVQLRLLGRTKKSDFLERWRGEKVTVLMENRNDSGWMSGLTPEYLRVETPYNENYTNRFNTVQVETILEESVRGDVVEENAES